MKAKLFFLLVVLLALLAACASGGNQAQPSAVTDTQTQTAVASLLTEEYPDALPIQSQLAVGTLQLESTATAVDETQAVELLPLWKALQSLTNSDTAADVEITAVINQIQETMTTDQLHAIATMQLTQASVQTMMEEGTLSMGFGRFGGSANDSNNASDLANALAGSGGPGGGPSGGMPGGGMPPRGGDPGMGGGMGGELGGDPGAMATRMAEMEASGESPVGAFQNSAFTNVVIRLLENKTGVAPSGMPGGGMFGQAMTAVSQTTGLTVEEVQAAMGEGQTLAQIIEANGGDIMAVQATLVEALADIDPTMLQDQTPEEFITALLNGNGRP